jgi:hypothetical protein
MDIKRNGSQPSGKGPAQYFTGTVRIDPLFQSPDWMEKVSDEQYQAGSSAE